jgi:type II secretory pathway component PulF
MDFTFPTFRRLLPSGWPWYTTAAQSQALLRLIATASENNLPLCPLLESWLADERGVQKRRLERLVRLLNHGASLAAAVEEVPGVLREEDLLAIRFDAQTGTRTAAIRARLADAQTAASAPRSGLRAMQMYACLIFPLAALVVVFTQIKIIPVMNHILVAYSLPAPDVLRWSNHLTSMLLKYWWLAALVLIALVSWFLVAKAGRLFRRAVSRRMFSPWRHTLAADVLRMLGLAIDVGRPIAGVLSTLARYHFDPTIRYKLLFVRNEVEQGVDVWQSMSAAGLLSAAEVHLLGTAERVGNRPWVLEQLAHEKHRRAARRWEKLGVLLLPGLVIAFGVFVLLHALTVFLPLTELIRAL